MCAGLRSKAVIRNREASPSAAVRAVGRRGLRDCRERVCLFGFGEDAPRLPPGPSPVCGIELRDHHAAAGGGVDEFAVGEVYTDVAVFTRGAEEDEVAGLQVVAPHALPDACLSPGVPREGETENIGIEGLREAGAVHAVPVGAAPAVRHAVP